MTRNISHGLDVAAYDRLYKTHAFYLFRSGHSFAPAAYVCRACGIQLERFNQEPAECPASFVPEAEMAQLAR